MITFIHKYFAKKLLLTLVALAFITSFAHAEITMSPFSASGYDKIASLKSSSNNNYELAISDIELDDINNLMTLVESSNNAIEKLNRQLDDQSRKIDNLNQKISELERKQSSIDQQARDIADLKRTLESASREINQKINELNNKIK